MHLVIVSHKVCWRSVESASGYVTDGGFPLQMQAISELFSSTKILVPCESTNPGSGVSELSGKDLTVQPLTVPEGRGLRRKFGILSWFIANGRTIFREVYKADAVHSPIPGDVGTFGMLAALLLRKRLFVRHCGNWTKPRTLAERVWKRSMEHFAGSRNVMLATGGSDEPPSLQNPNVQWIFSTSLRKNQIASALPRRLPTDGKLNLIIACRQEERKGTDIVIDSMKSVLEIFPEATLTVVGSGSLLERLKKQALTCGVADRVHFKGKIEQSEVLDLMREAHVFCYPTSASEGFPKVVLEAMACGLPVVTTKVSVLPRLIIAGGGILIDEPFIDSTVSAIKYICSDEDRYYAMSVKALETARQYTLENWRDSLGETLRGAWNVDSLMWDKDLIKEPVRL